MSYLDNLVKENILLKDITSDNLNIKFFKSSKIQTEGSIYYMEIFLKSWNVAGQVDYDEALRHNRIAFNSELTEKCNEMAQAERTCGIAGVINDNNDNGDNTEKFSEEEIEEASRITADAKPMMPRQSIEDILISKGYIRGTIVKTSAGGYGILTGEIKRQDKDNAALFLTNGNSFHFTNCEIITDVNKQILRTISAEKGRIREEAERFVSLIDTFVGSIIYGEDEYGKVV